MYGTSYWKISWEFIAKIHDAIPPDAMVNWEYVETFMEGCCDDFSFDTTMQSNHSALIAKKKGKISKDIF